jgi:hypothetical protein
MADWMKLGVNVGFGAAVGAVDQYVQSKDTDRAMARSKETGGAKLDLMSQYGTYLNYGVPLLAIVADVMGWLPKNWEEKILVSSGQLAGRHLAFRYTEEKYHKGFPNYDEAATTAVRTYMPAGGGYSRNAALEQQRQAQLEAARRRGANPQSETEIPIVRGDEILA